MTVPPELELREADASAHGGDQSNIDAAAAAADTGAIGAAGIRFT
jgi:hypothetical protein